MKCIGCGSVANQLGVDPSSAPLRRFEFFEHHDSGAFADHKSIPISFEWARSMYWVVIVGRQCSHRGETSDTHWSNGSFGTPTDHQIGVSALNDSETIAD